MLPSYTSDVPKRLKYYESAVDQGQARLLSNNSCSAESWIVGLQLYADDLPSLAQDAAEDRAIMKIPVPENVMK